MTDSSSRKLDPANILQILEVKGNGRVDHVEEGIRYKPVIKSEKMCGGQLALTKSIVPIPFFGYFGTGPVGKKVYRGILQIFKFEIVDSKLMNSQSTTFIELPFSIRTITRALIYITKQNI